VGTELKSDLTLMPLSSLFSISDDLLLIFPIRK
jgi:hypothetical protein